MITGPEPLLVLEAADAVRARAREEGCAEREVFDADGRDFDWDPLQATFHAPSLFSARRLIELRMPTARPRSEEHTSELQSLMRISYAVFCLKHKNINQQTV